MLRIIFALMAALLMVGCGPRYIDYFPYHDDGTLKPKVALIPVIDNSKCDVSWDLGAEFNSSLRFQAMYSGNLFVLSEEDVLSRLSALCQPGYFTTDLSFTNHFHGSDYVVAMELIEHDLVPFEVARASPAFPAQTYRHDSVLQMKMRLRVIDLRCGQPKIILQEVFTSCYGIPPGGECVDYSRVCWGRRAFVETPWGCAHKRMVCDLVNRIETVIRGL
jgi:hypothetical protein